MKLFYNHPQLWVCPFCLCKSFGTAWGGIKFITPEVSSAQAGKMWLSSLKVNPSASQ